MEQRIIDGILKHINDYNTNCYDLTGISSELKPSINAGKITFNLTQMEPILLQSVAEAQFLTKLGIPITFFGKLPIELQTAVVEYFNKGKEFLLRCVDKAGEQECRAVLSRIFTTEYDNAKVFPLVLPALATPDIDYQSFVLEDHFTRLDTRFVDTKVEWENEPIIGGINVTNSETGFSSLWIDPVVVVGGKYIFGSRVYAKDVWHGFRLVHKGVNIDPDKVSIKLASSIAEAKKAVQVGIIQYMEATQQKVTLKDASVFAASLDMLPKRFVGILEAQWVDQLELRRTEVTKDILRAAAELPILARSQIEQRCGDYLGLFFDYEKRLQSIIMG